MQFEELDERTLRISGLSPELAGIIKQAPVLAATRDEGSAAERLFPAPGTDEEMIGDWVEYVEPELRRLFESTEKTVLKDLKNLKPTGGRKRPQTLQIDIPRANAEAWLNCLNQARLVLAERIGYSESDHDRDISGPPRDERELKLFHIEFFALIQEWLIQELDGVPED